jgi:hypothetical protein
MHWPVEQIAPLPMHFFPHVPQSLTFVCREEAVAPSAHLQAPDWQVLPN